jgi:sigma-B regulation protein RsbU (phosphoserine phosphatase)
MDLMQFVCVLLIMFYILFQAGILKKIRRTDSLKVTIKENVILILLFGPLSIAATYLGAPIDPGNLASPIANVRNLAPLIAGMLGGPIAGIGAGLIGGVHRFLYSLMTGKGAATGFPCMLVTIAAGAAGGVIFILFKKKFPRPLFAVAFGIVFEILDMVVVYYLGNYPYPKAAFHTVSNLFVPMLLANTFGLFIFTFMVNRALNYQNIKEVKDKIEGELQTAHEIQISMLPRLFPPFPDRKEFDIYAVMNPAKNVGGDFYDFFFIDKNRLCIIIGDVSDKGVPAALFMTIIKTLLKTEALRAAAPDVVLKRVNEILYPDNESCSFATVFCGYLNVKTGMMEYSNGGHTPPFLISKGSEIETVKVNRNYMVGNLKEATFTTQKIKLQKNDILFMYTDGVTDAETEKGEMFTDKRLKTTLEKVCKGKITSCEIVKMIIDELTLFAGTAPQYDDTTIVAVRFIGEKPKPKAVAQK